MRYLIYLLLAPVLLLIMCLWMPVTLPGVFVALAASLCGDDETSEGAMSLVMWPYLRIADLLEG